MSMAAHHVMEGGKCLSEKKSEGGCSFYEAFMPLMFFSAGVVNCYGVSVHSFPWIGPSFVKDHAIEELAHRHSICDTS